MTELRSFPGKHLIAFDTETFLIGPGDLAPKLVCASFAWREDGEIQTALLGNHPDDRLEETLESMLSNADAVLTTCNGAYDYAVICRAYPRLVPLVFRRLYDLSATDVRWREKLLNLSTTGRLENIPLPDGSMQRVSYSLNDLCKHYLGVDMSHLKEGDDIWRLAYSTLDGWKAEEYPEDAASYAIGDAVHTLEVTEHQEVVIEEFPWRSLETEQLQLVKSFALWLHTCWGAAVDAERTEEMGVEVARVIDENKALLEQSGILRPEGMVGAPYKKFLDTAIVIALDLLGDEGYGGDWLKFNWTPLRAQIEARMPEVKWRKATAKPGTKDTAALQAHLKALYERLGEIPPETEGGSIQCDAEVQEYLAAHCPVMEQYWKRQGLQKLVTQILPVLREAPVVHPCYDPLKETGRTSSYDGGKSRKAGEPRLFSSVNGQQIPGDIKGLDPRQCIVPREGRVFFNVDYTALELACVAQVTYNLFGESKHLELYNAGIDLHSYLGAQLALKSPTTSHPLCTDFQAACRAEGIVGDPMAVYEAFMELKHHEDADVRGFFKHFRTFAKPVGLGYPGGLGPKTQVEFARKTYKVTMNEDLASMFREFWRETYPEMKQYHAWIEGQADPYNEGMTYTSILGMVRRGASFCAAANGCAMQTPGAEAATLADAIVTRHCYDPSQNSILLGCRPIFFVHDQIIGEVGPDSSIWHEQAMEVARVMRESAQMVLTDVKVRTDEAHLAARWSKASEPVFDDAGRLIPWTPSP